MNSTPPVHVCRVLHERVTDPEVRQEIIEECDRCNGRDGFCLFERMKEYVEQHPDS